MKARRVKGLDPSGSLMDNARRIVATRVDELYSFDPNGKPKELHNMRIAAKRLRYVLELTAPAPAMPPRRAPARPSRSRRCWASFTIAMRCSL